MEVVRELKHLDVCILGAEGLAGDHVAHVLLRDHGGLELGQVISITKKGFIQVTAVLHELGELVHGH